MVMYGLTVGEINVMLPYEFEIFYSSKIINKRSERTELNMNCRSLKAKE